MPDIQAFSGLRYDLGHIGSLGDVIAPPYDVIDETMQTELYEKHPANVIRLILNRSEPGDGDDSKYERASRFLKNWRSEGVLQTESAPSLYVYHQQFQYGGEEFTRRGFMCRVRLEPFGTGKIYPHEETHAAAKADRLKLFTACRANLSQIFGIYPDSSNDAQNCLEQAVQGQLPLEATDHLGVIHRVWPVNDLNVIAEASRLVGPQPMYVADGHHRYETACNYREQVADGGELPANHPANFVLTMCVGMSDPGMIGVPTHRRGRGRPAPDADQRAEKGSKDFDARIAGEGVDLAPMLWQAIEGDNEQGQMALYAAKDQRWVMAKLNANGASRMGQLASERSEDWQGLGVSILQRLIVEDLLGATSLPKPKYVHLVDELVEAVSEDDAASPEFPLSVMVMPATLDHVRAISEHGERMPAKSTYFYPKLLSGLVLNPLD